MNNELKFNIRQVRDGIYVETDMLGNISREFINTKVAATDKAIRERLIADGWVPPEMENAAPDMYRALRKMIDMHIEDFGCDGLDNEVIDEACAALAKADGEQL